MSEERAKYQVEGRNKRAELPAGTLLEYEDADYQPPTTEDVRAAMAEADLTGARLAALVGTTSRTVRRWTGGQVPMPYSAWRLLLMYLGRVAPPRKDP